MNATPASVDRVQNRYICLELGNISLSKKRPIYSILPYT